MVEVKYAAVGAFPNIFGFNVKDEGSAEVVCVAGAVAASKWVARRLRAIGYSVSAPVEVNADASEVASAVKRAFRERDVVVVVGGIEAGSAPAFEGVAAALGKRLVENEEARKLVEQYYLMQRGEEGLNLYTALPEGARSLFTLPEGSYVVPNPRGAAPGAILEEEGRYVVCLPGSMPDVCDMFEDEVDPYVRGLLGVSLSATVNVMTNTWDTVALGEIVEEVASRKPWIFLQLKRSVYSKRGWGIAVTVFARKPEELSDKLSEAVKEVESSLKRAGVEFFRR